MTKSRGLRVSKGTRPRWVAENQGRHLCGCGCGETIVLRDEHYPTVPRFRHGHNPTRTAAPPPRTPCECGCGVLATPGRRFISGHNALGRRWSTEARERYAAKRRGALNPMFGKRAPNYKGRIYHTDGYVLIWAPEHPFASNGRVMEHRLVFERHLRETEPDSPFLVRLGDQLYLRREIEVHHDDEVRDRNVLSNLVPMTKAAHAALHQARRLP